MKKEARIGFLVFFFTTIILLLVTWLKGNPFTPKTTLHVLFENVHGLSIGSTVEYAGLDSGKVKDFDVTTSGVLVEILINNPKVKIHAHDQFIIIPSSTIASEYQIFIIPKGGARVPDKASLIGHSTPGMQDFLFKAEETIDNMNLALGQLKGILANVDDSITEIKPLFVKLGNLSDDGTVETLTGNLKSTTKSIRDLSSNANNFLMHNESKLSNTLDNLSVISNNANSKLKSINEKDIQEILSSLKATSKNIEGISSILKPEEIKRDIKTFTDAAEQVKMITEKIQSDNPNEDVPSLIKTNLQRVDRIGIGLERSLKNKSLIKVLTNKIVLPSQEVNLNNNEREELKKNEKQSKEQLPKMKTLLQ